MRLLFVTHSLPPSQRPDANVGGMQRVAQDLLAEFERRATDPAEHLALDTLAMRASWRTTHVRAPFFLLRMRARLRELLLRGRRRPDAILFSSMVTAVAALGLLQPLRRRGMRLGVIVHGRDAILPQPLYQRLVRHVLGQMDAVFPVSRATAVACLERGARPGTVHVVPNGVHLPAASSADHAAARQRLLARAGVTGEAAARTFVLASLGRHVRRKGFVWFAEAVVPRLPAHVLWLVGGEGEAAEPLREAVERVGVGERVRLLGRISDALRDDLFHGADLLVMPNVQVPGDLEGFGVVMLEAGALGLPVVGSAIEGLLDVIEEGVSGHLVAPQDAAAFLQAIGRYAADPEALERLRRSTLAHTRATFSWARSAEGYLAPLRPTFERAAAQRGATASRPPAEPTLRA